ncbi:type II toxin-antitoxin system death-on-curing family toxin [Bradyrhizobium sp. C-145]|uniref:type II toxin-antitoxin system death-on-curing family toxin n=1 Tax=Bradyrhizobium TaxID=374 RepID=UPI0019D717F3|nr:MULTISPECIES: type II toxin-antitoxin system death-on-curing family toxin [Bradyrhizobium]UQR62526.1 type II toxin-antitoxin system death-on-curing family toxin [Bradyrhizobium sp. C-145]
MNELQEPLWIGYAQAVAIHNRQLRRFGGAPGIRDEDMLHSALERPLDKWRSEQAPLDELAAAYAFGLAKNVGFVDGNERIAFLTMMAFLRKNSADFSPDPAEAAIIIGSLAAGEVSEQSLARWIRDHWDSK